jgi:hypothetical protein
MGVYGLRFRDLTLLGVLALAGCGSVPQKVWNVSVAKDEFTDVETRMVTTAFVVDRAGTIYTKSGDLYPFVGLRRGVVSVGVRSGGKIRVPTGTVQLRIDDNPAWTITPEETQIDGVPAAGVPHTGHESAEDLAASGRALVARATSPYTSATGQKADEILRQMAHGHVLRYRTINVMQRPSTTGEVPIDQSFLDGLKEIDVVVKPE